MPKRRYDLVAGVQYQDAIDKTPVVVLKGESDLADTVVALALRFGVPIVENGALAEAMQSIPLDTEISEEIYRTVAVVLNQVDQRLARVPKRP